MRQLFKAYRKICDSNVDVEGEKINETNRKLIAMINEKLHSIFDFIRLLPEPVKKSFYH